MSVQKLKYWWADDKDELLNKLDVDPVRGLSEEEVTQSRKSFGSNMLEEIQPTSVLELIYSSVKEPMMILLLGIALLSILFGRIPEAIFMVCVVGAYITIEFINKFRTDQTMSKLRELTQPVTKVIRNSQIQEVKTSELVVGDIVILLEGVRVPADVRLIDSLGLLVNESSLTGESFPVNKDAQVKVDESASLIERKNSVFSGTLVLSGEGKGVVVAVGKESEFGIISKDFLEQRKQKTIVQEAMSKLVKILAILAIIVSLVIPFIGFLRGLNTEQMILTWLALTFLMVPGQPPVIIMMALALASFDLSKKTMIVKRLKGVEVLGQLSAIVTDKTGTITENKMKVNYFVFPNGETVKIDTLSNGIKNKINLSLPEYSNDPTDNAVKEALGEVKKELKYSCIKSFSENHPWRSLVYSSFCAIAGQPEKLIEFSQLSKDLKESLLKRVKEETDKGNRVIAYVFKNDAVDDLDSKVEFLALAVLSDPVREGVRMAIDRLRKAGISTYMVTGDHPSTAVQIAQQIGLDTNCLTGKDIENMDDEELEKRLHSVQVYARISPSQKERLVTLIRQNGKIIAVVGDGINDVPAIKAADMGIAMGEIGTDLAKESADLILTDDNYAHLPDAIEIGRKSIDNFRKGLTYYLSAKAILLFTFLVPLGLGIPFPFDPIHIIFIELLMDLASSTIFVTEKADPNIMKKSSQRTSDFLNFKIGWKILKNGLPLALGILGIYLGTYYMTDNVIMAQTAAFVTWLLGHILLALNLKQDRLPLLQQGISSNKFGLFWLISMVLMSLSITMIPALFPFLHTTVLPTTLWIAILIIIFSTTFWIEIAKNVRKESIAL